MTNVQKELERAALAAHRDGSGWDIFWIAHGWTIQQAAPTPEIRGPLARRLLSLVASGDLPCEPIRDLWALASLTS